MHERPATWADGDLHRVVAAATISTFGSMLTAVALPLLAIDTLGADSSDLSLLRVARLLPGLLLGLWIAGRLDQGRRRPVPVAADLASAALLAAVPLAAGGWLVQLVSAPFALALDALSFLGSACCLWTIRTEEPEPAPRPRRERRVREGLRAIASDPTLRILALAAILISFANEMMGVVYMLFVSTPAIAQPSGPQRPCSRWRQPCAHQPEPRGARSARPERAGRDL